MRGFPFKTSVRIAIPFILIGTLAWFWLDGSEPRARTGSRQAAPDASLPQRSVAVEPRQAADASKAPVAPTRKPASKSSSYDPVETGSGVLILEVSDRDTHRPVASCDLELWRLDAPGNENWTAGDQRQARARTTKKGEARIKDLPPGAYRVICADAALNSEDPPPFQVVDSTTRIRIEVPMPAPVPTFVKVYDERGRLIETARRSTAREMRTVHTDPPEWVRPRRRRNNQTEIGLGGGVGGGFTRPWTIRSDWRGFALGGIQANTRRSTYRSRVFLYLRSRAHVTVVASGEPTVERTYVAVAPHQEWFLRCVRLPDDRTAEEAGKSLVIHVTAVEADDYASALRQSCKVTIHCPGFKDLEFEWCPAEELPPLVLEPAK